MKPRLDISSVWVARETEGVEPKVFFDMMSHAFANPQEFNEWVQEQQQNLKDFEAKVQYPYKVDDRTIIQAPGEVIRR